jgi:hypothetical protein
MFGNKKLKKQIEFLTFTVEELKKTIETQELQALRFTKENYTKEREALSHIHIKLKDIKEVLCEDGFSRIEVKYEIPTIYLNLDGNGKPLRNEMFRSINQLDLLSHEDTLRIAKVLEETERKYNN